MHRVLIICSDQELRRRLEEFLADAGLLGDLISLSHYPAEAELSRILNIKRPHLVLALVTELKESQGLLAGIAEYCPTVPFVGITQIPDNRTMAWLMNRGARACLNQPLNRHLFVDTIRRLLAEGQTTEAGVVSKQVFSFLPAKGGSGASTLAANFASVAAQSFEGRVLLLDLDQGSGWSRFMLPNPGVHTLMDMLEAGAPLDETAWRRFVSRTGNLDLVTAGRPNPRHPILASQIRQLLDYAVSEYHLICVDLSGSFEAFSVEAMRRSQSVFVVASAEPAALSLAEHRARMLESLDLKDRASLLITRMAERPEIAAADIRREVGLPIAAEFRLDDRRLRDWLTQGELFKKDHSIWKQLQKASMQLFWPELQQSQPSRPGFFSL